jgi:hypothetical protein
MDTSSSSCSSTGGAKRRRHGDPVIKDVFFRRFFAPLIVSILILCGIVAIISTPPGTGINWQGFATAFGDTAKTAVKVGGRRR